MSIEKLVLSDFRNHKKTSLTFSPGVNVIWGKNGSGKTSALEAIHILSVGKSFRTNKIQETIKTESLQSKLVGVFVSDTIKNEISVRQNKNKNKKITINNAVVTMKEILGRNPAVILSPEEQSITSGSPKSKRKYFDRVFSVVSRQYLNNLVSYTKTLKNRNFLLKKRANKNELSPWEIKLAEFGSELWKEKNRLGELFDQKLKEACKNYNKGDVLVSLNHKIKEEDPSAFLSALEKNKERDRAIGYTTYGPHTDRHAVFFNNQNIRSFGSQGEHKISLVLIKIAEYELIKKETQTTPTILLDDLFATLDFERGDAVLELLEKNTQTIITNTDLVDIESHGINLDGTNNKSIHLVRECKN